jgi:hypothetical protein
LAFGEAELKSRKKASRRMPGAQAAATATVWLAVTAEITRSADDASAACEGLSPTPRCSACARIAKPSDMPSFTS